MRSCVSIGADSEADHVSVGHAVAAVEAGRLALKGLGRSPYPGRHLADAELPQFQGLGYWDASNLQDWGVSWHRDTGLKLVFLENGSLPVGVMAKRHMLRPGDLAIVSPWQYPCVGSPFVTASRLHWLALGMEVSRLDGAWHWPDWIVLTDADRDELATLLHRNGRVIWPAMDPVRVCFERITEAVESDRRGGSLSRLTVLLNELFIELLDMLRHADGQFDPSIRDTSHRVELFLADLQDDPDLLCRSWTLKDMAECCGLAATRFRHYCRHLTNMTPGKFVESCRIAAASKMLVEHLDQNITAIAFRYGFRSSQYFSTVFRRHMGISPKGFRSKHRCGSTAVRSMHRS